MASKPSAKPTILTITGSDSTGGSGIQADIKTITALGGYAASAITAVTAQSTADIQHLYDIPPTILKLQIQSVMEDIQPVALKLGMLRSVGQVDTVAELINQYNPPFVVLDVVVVSSRGDLLMSDEVVAAIKQRLFPLCTVIVVKIESAFLLVGDYPVKSNDDLERLARFLLQMGGQAVLLQGGNIVDDSVTDVLVTHDPAETVFTTRSEAINRNTHGAGGAFSSAMATFLCKDHDTKRALEHANAYVNQLILHSVNFKLGRGGKLLDHGADSGHTRISPRLLELYNALMNQIATQHRKSSDVAFYAEQLHVSSRYLAQATRQVTGHSPKELIDDYILKEVEAELMGSTRNIQEIAFRFGFSSQAQFNKFFRKKAGCTPSAYRNEHA